MKVRPEQAGDQAGIRHIHLQAFGGDSEAKLVDRLRNTELSLISLVAEEQALLVGHILFSPVSLVGPVPAPPLAGLAPMAVVPQWQRRGVGRSLVTTGLEYCARANYVAVVVLGHPEYYPRFGFVPASRFQIKCEYDVPDEVFMLKELQPSALQGISGTIHYHPAFQQV